MKKFTVKDFIVYNNPCINCNRPINFNVLSENFVPFNGLTNNSEINSKLATTVSSDFTEVDLIIKYSSPEFLKLQIHHTTNKITTNNVEELKSYLKNHALFLSSRCTNCNTIISSKDLKINLDKGYVAAVEIKNEYLNITDGNNIYTLTSIYDRNITMITIHRLDAVKPLSPFSKTLPLLPKYKFKNKEHFIQKMRTYLTFS